MESNRNQTLLQPLSILLPNTKTAAVSPDFSVLVVLGRGLDLKRRVLLGERGSEGRGGLNVPGLDGSAQLYAGVLCTENVTPC